MRSLFACRWCRLICLIIVAYGSYLGYRFWKGRNDGFSVANISSSFANSPAWEIPATAEKLNEVNQILSQPFHYIGHGFQFYAFESEDGIYVLKFMRHQRLRSPMLYDWLPNLPLIRDLKERKAEARQKRVDYLFRSLIVAYEDVPKETGMVYLHLNKSSNTHPKVVIFDKLQDHYEMSVDATEFVIQYKATLVKSTIKTLMQSGQVKDAKARIDQIFALLRDCAKKGVSDTDGALIHKNNLGFLKDRAIYIDTGKLTRKESMKNKERFEQDLRRLRPLYKWLAAHYPPLAAHFNKQQKKTLDSF